jgi:two-component system LytT family sensor kinase
MDGTDSPLALTLYALGFATGAALCTMMAVMQWRSGRGFHYMLSWLSGIIWTSGGFAWVTLLLAGFSPASPELAYAKAFAWSSTATGQAGLSWIYNNEANAPRWWRKLLVYTSLAWAIVLFGLLWWRLPTPIAPTETVSIIAFFVALVFIAAYAPGFASAIRRAEQPPRPWVIRVGATIAAVQLGALLFSILFRQVPGASVLGATVGAQWPIPWVIFAAVFFARTHYADVILKRSLALIASVILAALLMWALLGDAEGWRYVLASLAVAALLLAAPVMLRGIGWIVDHAVLRRPDYRTLARDFADQSRRLASPTELFAAATRLIEEALHLSTPFAAAAEITPDAERFAIAGRPEQLELTMTNTARVLLQKERSFLDAILVELSRRLEAIAFERERAERQLREGRLQHAVTEAELKALRAQVDPHFLFNTLNAIADLVTTDPAKAEAMTERLAAFFRYTLASQHRTFSTLHEELAFTRQYLDIEQVRYGDRLSVEVSSDASLGASRVPTLILQPLIENAVRHGLAPRREGGCVRISASIRGSSLQLEVADDGVGIPLEKEGRRKGVGLENVRARLDAIYGSASSVTIGAGAHGRGTSVRLILPARDH